MNKAANVFNKIVKKLFPSEVKHIDYLKGTKLHLKGKEADTYIKTQRSLSSMKKTAVSKKLFEKALSNRILTGGLQTAVEHGSKEHYRIGYKTTKQLDNFKKLKGSKDSKLLNKLWNPGGHGSLNTGMGGNINVATKAMGGKVPGQLVPGREYADVGDLAKTLASKNILSKRNKELIEKGKSGQGFMAGTKAFKKEFGGIKTAEDENTRRLKRGAGAALGIAATIGATIKLQKKPTYIKTKFRGDVKPLLNNLKVKGKKLKEQINEHQIMQDDYITAKALAKHGPMDKKNKDAIQRMKDVGIIALASLRKRSANKH